MKKMRIRKIIMFSIIIICVIGICFALYLPYKKSIEEQKKEIYYTEEDVQKLEYLLKGYYEKEYTDEDIEKAIFYNMIETYGDKYPYYTDYNIEEIISDKLSGIKEDREHYSHDFGYNDHFIRQGDYHELAVALMESYNEEMIEHDIADELEEIDSITETIIIVIFVIAYGFVIFRFIFLKLFDKDKYLKDIGIFAVCLLSLFILNIVVNYIYEIIINSFGNYETFNVSDIINYGIFDVITLIIIFAVSVILNALINIKYIIDYFKSKKKIKWRN